mmetsp:Transcript_20139/g.34747  ORF Transcript_20139/g.34747 Transcript_20139/m.34747 type:complete len:292 (-) Transcript_20139:1293-2168(-)
MYRAGRLQHSLGFLDLILHFLPLHGFGNGRLFRLVQKRVCTASDVLDGHGVPCGKVLVVLCTEMHAVRQVVTVVLLVQGQHVVARRDGDGFNRLEARLGLHRSQLQAIGVDELLVAVSGIPVLVVGRARLQGPLLLAVKLDLHFPRHRGHVVLFGLGNVHSQRVRRPLRLIVVGQIQIVLPRQVLLHGRKTVRHVVLGLAVRLRGVCRLFLGHGILGFRLQSVLGRRWVHHGDEVLVGVETKQILRSGGLQQVVEHVRGSGEFVDQQQSVKLPDEIIDLHPSHEVVGSLVA